MDGESPLSRCVYKVEGVHRKKTFIRGILNRTKRGGGGMLRMKVRGWDNGFAVPRLKRREDVLQSRDVYIGAKSVAIWQSNCGRKFLSPSSAI